MQRLDRRCLASLSGCMIVLCLVSTSAGQSVSGQTASPDDPLPEKPEAPCMQESQRSASPPAYKLLRADEDYSYLRDPSQRMDIWDCVKYLPLNVQDDWYLSVGGEVRERCELYHNPAFGQGPQDSHGNNAYFLQRYMFLERIKPNGLMEKFPRLKAWTEALMNRPSTHSFPAAEFEAMYRANVKRRNSWLSQFIESARAAAE